MRHLAVKIIWQGISEMTPIHQMKLGSFKCGSTCTVCSVEQMAQLNIVCFPWGKLNHIYTISMLQDIFIKACYSNQIHEYLRFDLVCFFEDAGSMIPHLLPETTTTQNLSNLKEENKKRNQFSNKWKIITIVHRLHNKN